MRAIEFLVEFRLDKITELFGEKLKLKFATERTFPKGLSNKSSVEDVVNWLGALDPDQAHHSHVQWMVTKYLKDEHLKIEDFGKLASSNPGQEGNVPGYLEKYEILKRKNKLQPEQKDLNRFDFHQLMDIVDSFEEKPVTSKKDEKAEAVNKWFKEGEAELVYKGPEGVILIPKTQEASCFFGIDTRWCTAASKSQNMFNQYNKQGPLYIIMIRGEKDKYQLHLESNQLMNPQDRPVDVNVFRRSYPWVFEKLGQYWSEDFKKKTILKNADAIKYFANPSEELQRYAVKHLASVCQYIDNPLPDIQLDAVKRNPLAFTQLLNPTKEVIDHISKTMPSLLKKTPKSKK